MNFVDEQHGTGPRHCSATLDGGLVIEIYPAGDAVELENTRLGFRVSDLDVAMAAVVACGGRILSEAPGGTVIEDLDGRRVELLRS